MVGPITLVGNTYLTSGWRNIMNNAKWLYGRMHFEDGVRSVLMWRGPKYFHAFYIDACYIFRRYVLFHESKFFEERGNSDENPKLIKKYIKVFLNRSKLTGLPRQMPKATKKTLKGGLEL